MEKKGRKRKDDSRHGKERIFENEKKLSSQWTIRLQKSKREETGDRGVSRQLRAVISETGGEETAV
jgi:hypothetical protein